MECPRCQGSGVCLECQGSGKIECPACGGKGKKSTPRGVTYNCKACGGEGTVACPLQCSSCGGSGEITEELQNTVRAKYSRRLANTTPLSQMSVWLVGINFVVFVLTNVIHLGSVWLALVNFNTSPLHWQLWRFVTPMAVHVGWIHLMLNCWFLALYCPPIEGLYGSWRFLALYLLSGIAGNVASWLAWCHFGHHLVAGVGASGALFGVAAAYIGLHLRWHLFEDRVVRIWSAYVIGFIVAGFVAQFLGLNILHIDNWAHLGGFLLGLAWVWLTPRPTGR